MWKSQSGFHNSLTAQNIEVLTKNVLYLFIAGWFWIFLCIHRLADFNAKPTKNSISKCLEPAAFSSELERKSNYFCDFFVFKLGISCL